MQVTCKNKLAHKQTTFNHDLKRANCPIDAPLTLDYQRFEEEIDAINRPVIPQLI